MKKIPEYLSPSTFMIAEDCELSAYILKWCGIPQSRYQTRPMAMGSAFDSFIKAEIAKKMGKTKSSTFLAKLLENVSIPEIIPAGKKLAEQYIDSGCLNRLLDDGLEDIEIDFKKVEIFGIPVYCRLDAFMFDLRPVDFKVNGFESSSGGSIKPGYFRRIRDGHDSGYHRDQGCPMETIDRKWAVQLAFYWWVLHHTEDISGPVSGRIEQVCIKPYKTEFVSYDAPVSTTFSIELKANIQSLWYRVLKGEFHKPTPSIMLCHPYGHPRDCVNYCPLYKKKFSEASKNVVDLVMYGNTSKR